MNRDGIDPRYFNGQFGYSRAVLLEQPTRWLLVAGHEARDDDGGIAAPGDLRAQIRITFQRIEETLDQAGFALSGVVQLRIFTLDIDAMTSNYDAVTGILADQNYTPTNTIQRSLDRSDMLVLNSVLAMVLRLVAASFPAEALAEVFLELLREARHILSCQARAAGISLECLIERYFTALTAKEVCGTRP